MCVILKGRVRDIRKLDLRSAWSSNPHGAGIAYSHGGRVKTVKGLMTLDGLKDALKAIDPKTEIALHLRYATHGAIVASNTHPFPMGGGAVLMHNGVLSAFGKSGTCGGGVSDSADLAATLGRLKAHGDRIKLLDSIGGMFGVITGKGVTLHGSRSWCRVGRGVLASNDHWVGRMFDRQDALDTAPLVIERSRWVWD